MRFRKLLITILVLLVLSPLGAQIRPSVIYDSLFVQAQEYPLFKDSKTFPDCNAKVSPALIMTQYYQHRYDNNFNLKSFFNRYFSMPQQFSSGFKSDTTQTVKEHVKALWPALVRKTETVYPWSSLIPLPYSFVVPGGRFREIYYWDSYFTMLGLAKSGRDDLVKDMLDNFKYLIDTLGFIPNGNRTYYLGRSQPPFFALMVQLWGDIKGKEAMKPYLDAMVKEYNFWMEGKDKLKNAGDTYRNVVMMDDNIILNRYWDRIPEPRPEAYKEDVATAKESGRSAGEVYTDLRATAESGWDFSSRWFSDHQNLKTIMTTKIVPVDLNCLLYNLEMTIAEVYQSMNDTQQSDHFRMLASQRRDAINKFFYNASEGIYSDYNLVTKRVSDQITLAAASPLFLKVAPEDKGNSTAHQLIEKLDKPGGFVTTTYNTGQQWDYPNGWPPLEYMAIMGLNNYGFTKDAKRIAGQWLELNDKVYHNTGKMMEKYNVVDINATAGGGEYPLQDGFGWTNGVYLALQAFITKRD